MANYLHGAEVIEKNDGVRPIRTIASGVIGLVGIAPIGPKNVPTVVYSLRDAAQFGAVLPGYNIPAALRDIFAQGPATVIVVNTFDQNGNGEVITAEAHVVNPAGKFSLFAAPQDVADVAFYEADGTTLTGWVAGTDYKLDAYGNFTALSAEVVIGATYKVNYRTLDAATVTASQIVGSTTFGALRTGMDCFDICETHFGFKPKILISPTYCELPAVAAALATKADKFSGVYIVDAAYGTLRDGVVAARGPAGGYAPFNTSSDRAILCWPYVLAYNPATGLNSTYPLSQFLAGVMANVDAEEGYHVSPSNHEIKGITGPAMPITAAIDDPNSDTNVVNAAGITTVFSAFGTGFRVWGNRSAAYPTETLPKNFICVRRTADVVADSVVVSSLPFVDRPLNMATIDAIRQSVNVFLATLIARGALVDGVCKYIAADNPPTELAQGRVKFAVELMPPTPAERISYEMFINLELLKALA